MPQNAAQLPSAGSTLFATMSAEGEFQNICLMPATSCLLAKARSCLERPLTSSSALALKGVWALTEDAVSVADAAWLQARVAAIAATAKNDFFMVSISHQI